jgi:hypothetical protein
LIERRHEFLLELKLSRLARSSPISQQAGSLAHDGRLKANRKMIELA